MALLPRLDNDDDNDNGNDKMTGVITEYHKLFSYFRDTLTKQHRE